MRGPTTWPSIGAAKEGAFGKSFKVLAKKVSKYTNKTQTKKQHKKQPKNTQKATKNTQNTF